MEPKVTDSSDPSILDVASRIAAAFASNEVAMKNFLDQSVAENKTISQVIAEVSVTIANRLKVASETL